MVRFGQAFGGKKETLSGLGDLVLTCSSTNSRNFSFGKGLGEGRSAAGLLSDRRMVAEGVFTAPVLRDRARALRVEVPVVEDVRALIESSIGVAAMISPV